MTPKPKTLKPGGATGSANMLSQHVVDHVEPSFPHIRDWLKRHASAANGLGTLPKTRHMTLSTTVRARGSARDRPVLRASERASKRARASERAVPQAHELLMY